LNCKTHEVTADPYFLDFLRCGVRQRAPHATPALITHTKHRYTCNVGGALPVHAPLAAARASTRRNVRHIRHQNLDSLPKSREGVTNSRCARTKRCYTPRQHSKHTKNTVFCTMMGVRLEVTHLWRMPGRTQGKTRGLQGGLKKPNSGPVFPYTRTRNTHQMTETASCTKAPLRALQQYDHKECVRTMVGPGTNALHVNGDRVEEKKAVFPGSRQTRVPCTLNLRC